ncbi:MAG: hypothetical protein KAV87_43475 [Desulfobacteraceae bacterium]|nr:hypothetical protein [Desulfobacteraceae bacterium]
MSRQLSKPDLELWTGLTRIHVKALRAGKNVTDRFTEKNGPKFLLIMGVELVPEKYAPLEVGGWEVLLCTNTRDVWQQFKRKDRRMTVQFDLEGYIIHVHILSWDNFKKAMEMTRKID